MALKGTTSISLENQNVELIQKHLNYIREQFQNDPGFSISNYIKTAKLNHNLTLAMVRSGYLEKLGPRKYKIREEPFEKQHTIAVIRMTKNIQNEYVEKARQNKLEKKRQEALKKREQHVENLVKQTAPEVEPDTIEKVQEDPKDLKIQKLIESNKLMMEVMEQKDKYIEHLHGKLKEYYQHLAE